MIKAVKLYQVFCDSCGKLFDNEEPPLRMNECHLYTSIRRAEIGIEVAGWKVIKNAPGLPTHIFCPRCVSRIVGIKPLTYPQIKP